MRASLTLAACASRAAEAAVEGDSCTMEKKDRVSAVATAASSVRRAAAATTDTACCRSLRLADMVWCC